MMRELGRLVSLVVIAIGLWLAQGATAQHHTADITASQSLELGELLRVIQFANAAGFHCDAGTQDGYAPYLDTSRVDCPPHDSDYAPQDWRISVTELLRLVQFFNTGAYHTDCGTEDGFAPGAGDLFTCGAEGEGEGEGEAPFQLTFITEGQFANADRILYSNLYWRLPPGGVPENMTEALTPFQLPLFGREGGSVAPAPDGSGYWLTSNRFDSDSAYGAISRVTPNLTGAAAVTVGGAATSTPYARVSPNGQWLAFIETSSNQLQVAERLDGAWAPSTALAPASGFASHKWPAFDPSSTYVVFALGASTYSSDHIARVNVDGSGYEVLLTSEDAPEGWTSGRLRCPVVEQDGSIVFEAHWQGGGSLWRRTPDGAVARIAPDMDLDKSPLILPDGRIASVWSDHPESPGAGQIKVMAPDGSEWEMWTLPSLTPEIDEVRDSEDDVVALGVGPWSEANLVPPLDTASLSLELDTRYTIPNGYVTFTPHPEGFIGTNIWYAWTAGGESRIYTAPPYTVGVGVASEETIEVTAHNGLQSATASATVTTADAPWELVLTSDKPGGIAPVEIAFTAEPRYQEFLGDNSYDWNFGAETVYGLGPQVTHSFESGGEYEVEVTARDGDNNAISASITISVTEPEASLTPETVEGPVPLTADFEVDASGFANPVESYVWDFGDGTQRSGEATDRHVYATAGDYTAQVIVSDGASTATATATVSALDPGITLIADPTHGLAPLAVSFTTAGLNLSGGITYTWTVGEAAPAAGTDSRAETFTAPGSYDVMVEASNGEIVATDTVTVTVLDVPPAVTLVADPPFGSATLDVIAEAQLTGTWPAPVSYTWDIGDGPVDGPAWRRMSFDADGEYPVSVTVTDGIFTASDTVTISVGSQPTATASIDAAGGTVTLDGAELSVPAGLLSEPTEISLVELPSFENAFAQGQKATAAGKSYRLEGLPDSAAPMTLTLPYTPGKNGYPAVAERILAHYEVSEAASESEEAYGLRLGVDYLFEPAVENKAAGTVSYEVYGEGEFQAVTLDAPIDMVFPETTGKGLATGLKIAVQDEPTALNRSAYIVTAVQALIDADQRYQALGLRLPLKPITLHIKQIAKPNVWGEVALARSRIIVLSNKLNGEQISRTAPHEAMHCIQFANSNYRSDLDNWDQIQWVLEGTAEWGTDEVYDTQLAGNYSAPTFTRFTKPLNTLATAKNEHYKAVAYWKWLHAKHPNTIQNMLDIQFAATHTASSTATVRHTNSAVVSLEDSYRLADPLADFHGFARSALFLKDFDTNETQSGDLWHVSRLGPVREPPRGTRTFEIKPNQPGSSITNPLTVPYSLKPHMTADMFTVWTRFPIGLPRGVNGKLHLQFEPLSGGETVSASMFAYRYAQQDHPLAVDRTIRNHGAAAREIIMPFHQEATAVTITDDTFQRVAANAAPLTGQVTVWVEDPCSESPPPVTEVSTVQELKFALANAPANSTIDIAPGTYYLVGENQYNDESDFVGRSGLLLDRGLVLQGAGEARTHLVGAGVYDAVVLMFGNGGTIRDLTIQAFANYPLSGGPPLGVGIWCNNITAMALCSVTIRVDGVNYDGSGIGIFGNGDGARIDATNVTLLTGSTFSAGQGLTAIVFYAKGGVIQIVDPVISGWEGPGAIYADGGIAPEAHLWPCDGISGNIDDRFFIAGPNGTETLCK